MGCPACFVYVNFNAIETINSPHFIPDLAPGLYNVQKIYNDGSSQETVILKENNE